MHPMSLATDSDTLVASFQAKVQNPFIDEQDPKSTDKEEHGEHDAHWPLTGQLFTVVDLCQGYKHLDEIAGHQQ